MPKATALWQKFTALQRKDVHLKNGATSDVTTAASNGLPQRSEYQLCSTCRGAIQNLEGTELNRHEFGDDDKRQLQLHLSHHTTFEALRHASDQGCRLCRVIWEKLPEQCQSRLLDAEARQQPCDEHYHWHSQQSFATKIWFQITKGAKKNSGFGFHIVFTEAVDKLGGVNPRQVLAFFLKPVKLLEHAERSPAKCLSTSTASPEPWSAACRWVEECSKTHKSCQNASSDWYPTRLLEIGGSGRLRVIETGTVRPVGHYMTISHRWTSQPSLILTHATKGALLGGFDTAQLPTAIKDAVLICKQLDVAYLWVDTLCILQHDEDLADWKRESTTMNRIYENSFLNISALAAKDTEHSFFAERDPKVVEEVHISTRLQHNSLRLGRKPEDYRIADYEFWVTHVHNAHLNKRAWVLQERQLAPRVLHFSRHQLLWECAELKAAETYPAGLPEETITSMSSHLIKVDLEFRDLKSEQMLRELYRKYPKQESRIDDMLYEAWHEVVSGYSRCKATNAADKLVAVSGLAKRMGMLVKDEYVVGMWRRHLPSELMWYSDNYIMTEDEYPGPRRPQPYRAPTFSWASMDAIIIPGELDDMNMAIRILDVQLGFATDDRTSLCTSGFLMLGCRLQRIAVAQPEPSAKALGKRERRVVKITVSDGALEKIDAPNLDELSSFFETAGRSDLYSVPWQILPPTESDPDVMIHYLLFQAIDGEAGTFKRVGTARYVGPGEKWQRYLSAGPEAVNYPCISYEDGRHTIKVI